ncbi:SAF domain-containing protein [Corynebacterium tapiri]|uniref:SAF domain-containing protein n=1 Tax=Corynebacterium tapiri TaxID=1448266 RepID=A0A5C4U735_9CORY|nr:SAF domain-containing protein [Corynebacterium tapiri]TNM00428.1 hypothetical protein FHE74_00290 [Corynebacterium tapiri]
MQTPSFLNHLRAPGYRRQVTLRRICALALLAVAVALAVAHARQRDPHTLVFSKDVAPGATLRSEDVTLRRVPKDLIPSNALTSLDEVTGRQVLSAAVAGELVTATRVTGQEALTALGADAAGSAQLNVVPVRLADPATAAVLEHGDTISVVTAAGDEPQGQPIVIAERGRVVVADDENPDTVLIAFPSELATRVAAASLTSPLSVVLLTSPGP